jgi:hypothetical protein
VDDRGNDVQDFSITGIWHVALVVKQDGVKQRWHHAVVDHLQVICFLDIDLDKLENLFLDRS